MTAVLVAVLIGFLVAVLVVGLGTWLVDRAKRARFRSQYMARSRSRFR
jgi:cytochrome oxidase assembly protein ShyY1